MPPGKAKTSSSYSHVKAKVTIDIYLEFIYLCCKQKTPQIERLPYFWFYLTENSHCVKLTICEELVPICNFWQMCNLRTGNFDIFFLFIYLFIYFFGGGGVKFELKFHIYFCFEHVKNK